MENELFKSEFFDLYRTKEDQAILKRLYNESGCNKDLYYFIISQKLLKNYTFKEQLTIVSYYIKSQFNDNLHKLIQEVLIHQDNYSYEQFLILAEIAEKNEYDEDLINIMSSKLWATLRNFEEVVIATEIYLQSKKDKRATIGILKKNHILRERSFEEQMLLVYLYETFKEYYCMYYLATDKKLIQNRTFAEQLLLTAAYLETPYKRKAQRIALNKELLENATCQYQLQKIMQNQRIHIPYFNLLKEQEQVLKNIRVQKILKLEQFNYKMSSFKQRKNE